VARPLMVLGRFHPWSACAGERSPCPNSPSYDRPRRPLDSAVAVLDERPIGARRARALCLAAWHVGLIHFLAAFDVISRIPAKQDEAQHARVGLGLA